MTGNGHVQFGGGLMEKGPCATSPAAYPTKALILMNAAAWLCAHNLCGAPHKLCYVASRVMWSHSGDWEKHMDMQESWTFAALPHCT